MMPRVASGLFVPSVKVMLSPAVDSTTRKFEPSIEASTPVMPSRAASSSANVSTSPEPPSLPKVMVVAAPPPTAIWKVSPAATPSVFVAANGPAVRPRLARPVPPSVRSSPFWVVMVMAPEPSMLAEPAPRMPSMALTRSAAVFVLPAPKVMVEAAPPSTAMVSVSPFETAVSETMSVEPDRPATFAPVVVASKSSKLAIVRACEPWNVAVKSSKLADVTVFELVFVAVKLKKPVAVVSSSPVTEAVFPAEFRACLAVASALSTNLVIAEMPSSAALMV